MTSSGSVALWGILFVGTHMLLPARSVRSRFVSLLTERGYQLLYWVVSLVTFLPFVVLFARHKGTGAVLWRTASGSAVWWLSHFLMIVGLVIFIAGLMVRSPVSMFGGSTEVRGILKVTRSPVFIGFSLFGISHMLVNGSTVDLFFFGSFPLLGLLGGWHQDRRKLAEQGSPVARFIEETSLLPAMALVSGKQRWSAADTPWLAIPIAAALYLVLVFLGLHAVLFGGDPLG